MIEVSRVLLGGISISRLHQPPSSRGVRTDTMMQKSIQGLPIRELVAGRSLVRAGGMCTTRWDLECGVLELEG